MVQPVDWTEDYCYEDEEAHIGIEDRGLKVLDWLQLG